MKKAIPQKRPGSEKAMQPDPVSNNAKLAATPKLKNKIALITGGDSGIGKAVAILFAKEGADMAISYWKEHKDAKDTKATIEQEYGRKCILIPGDISNEQHCKRVIRETIKQFKKIDVLVNNAAIHYEAKSLEDITTKQLKHTFEVNIYSMFFITKYALPYMKKGSCIINSSSVTAYRGSKSLIDYSATKGAIVSFTRSLSENLVQKGIRVNGVAPGPIWTPLIVSSFDKKRIKEHGKKAPMQRPGEPVEVAPSYLFLACDDSSYISGQFLHPNGGEIVNT
jgi:NAD(P)-dependent dehydrogenase (short-subunit alcohol dehydrogenase family)